MSKLLRWSVFIGAVLRGVAQFGSALGSGPRGRGFKSRRLDQKKKKVVKTAFFFFLIVSDMRRDLMGEKKHESAFVCLRKQM